MAAFVPPPPAKKPHASAFPQRRGKVKAQIFGGIAETVSSAASRAFSFLKKDDDLSAPASPPPKTTKTIDG